MVKHPEELGFKLGLTIRIGEPTLITKETPDASTLRDVVYVALLAENNRTLGKRDVLKIGQTTNFMGRWRGIVSLFKRDKLRKNEKDDRRKWLEVADGKEVEIWVKAAGKIEIPYAGGLTKSSFSTRGAEEEFLDQYYQPKLGIKLNRVATEGTDQIF